LALAAACSSSSSSLKALPTTVPITAAAVLEQASGTHRITNIVKVPNGYEAASWSLPATVRRHRAPKRLGPFGTASGELTFWASRGGETWRRIGESRYTSIDSTCTPTVTAGMVVGASDAVYIAKTCPTGDGDLNAIGYADGTSGWGVLEPTGLHGLVSRGHAETWQRTGGFEDEEPGSALRYELAFSHGELETIDPTGYFSNAENDEFPRDSYWRWSGGHLVEVSTNAFVAVPASTPHLRAPTLPVGRCPEDGTYSVSFGVVYYPFVEPLRQPNVPLKVAVFPPATHYPDRLPCTRLAASNLSITVLLAHSPRPGSRHAPLSHRRWMTAPLWLVVIGDDGFIGSPISLFVGREAAGMSSYVVPVRNGVNVLVAHLGSSVPPLKHRNLRPTAGIVTFQGGKIVGLAVRP
jgi:hypothetical protein